MILLALHAEASELCFELLQVLLALAHLGSDLLELLAEQLEAAGLLVEETEDALEALTEIRGVGLRLVCRYGWPRSVEQAVEGRTRDDGQRHVGGKMLAHGGNPLAGRLGDDDLQPAIAPPHRCRADPYERVGADPLDGEAVELERNFIEPGVVTL